VEKLAGGFYDISGGAADPAGDFYFVDAHWQRIYRWSAASRRLSLVRDNPLDPINLAFDKAGDLLVVSYAGAGTVYAFQPKAPGDEITLLKPQPAAAQPNRTPVLPTSDWRVRLNPQTGEALPRPVQYLSPDGATYLSAGQDFANGAQSYGVKSADLLRSFGLAPAIVGKPFYITDESEAKTFVATVGPDGNLTGTKLFVEQGGESVAVDAEGNVYLAAGRIYVYDSAGRRIDAIDVPERPVQLVFGGPDGQTLFIAARATLYSVRTRIKGR
jgi:sugar lactone lactonase YvrE